MFEAVGRCLHPEPMVQRARSHDLVAFLQTLTDGFVTVTPASLSKPTVVRKAALPPHSH